MNEMTLIRDLKETWKKRSTRQFLHRKLWKTILYSKYTKPIDIMSADWDNLIILDALRYDHFREVSDFSEDPDYRITKASFSKQFMEKNFTGEDLHDTVYVTANVFSTQLADDIFYKLIPVFTEVEGNPMEIGNHAALFSPKRVFEASVKSFSNNNNKRHIIHFMQPHRPYFGKTAADLRKELSNENKLIFSSWEPPDINHDEGKVVADLMKAYQRGYISKTTMVNVYKRNIKYVLKFVRELLEKIEGKTIITSDHGEMFGESVPLLGNVHAHTPGCYTRELRQVPWLTIDTEDRREIYPNKPLKDDVELDEQDLHQHLKTLGYK